MLVFSMFLGVYLYLTDRYMVWYDITGMVQVYDGTWMTWSEFLEWRKEH